MADQALFSALADRLVNDVFDQIGKEIGLVKDVKKEVLNLSQELRTVANLLDDADRRGYKEKSIRDWLRRLEHAAYEMEDVVDEWSFACRKTSLAATENASSRLKVCSPFNAITLCLPLKKLAVRRDIAMKIIQVKEKLNQILPEKDRFGLVLSSRPVDDFQRAQTTSFLDMAEVQGRDFETDALLSQVLAMAPRGSLAEIGHPQIVSVVGVGGLGKTTLAKLVYNDCQVKQCYDLRVWICVSDSFDVVGIAKGIIEGAERSSPSVTQLDTLLKHVEECISGKKFLVVLDDVWTEDPRQWEPLKDCLKCGGVGSKVVVTTRNERVAKMMGTLENGMHRPGVLSDENCWLLLRQVALSGKSEEECERYRDIGMAIANKCKGLPLAAKVLGSHLQFKRSLEEWEEVLNSETWELKEAEDDLFHHFLLSYNELPPALKRCFSYSSVFPKDFRIRVHELIGHWMALGYLGSDGSGGDMELRGRQYFNILAMRSLFQDCVKEFYDNEVIRNCKMHDIVHDFGRYLRADSGVVESGSKDSVCEVCHRTPSALQEMKEYRSLLRPRRGSLDICINCVSSVRVLNLSYESNMIPRGLEKLIHLRWLDLSGIPLSTNDVRKICKLYNLQTLFLRRCYLAEIPMDIGNLIHLRDLNLEDNVDLRELPQSISNLHELRMLWITFCFRFSRLPKGIGKLKNLKHLHNVSTKMLQFPEEIAQLTGLCTLGEFPVRKVGNKLGWLKNLNRLSGFLQLGIELGDWEGTTFVKDLREGELRKKQDLTELRLEFIDTSPLYRITCDLWMEVMDALEPPPKLQRLFISGYKGSKLASPTHLNQLKSITLRRFKNLTSLPHQLGTLPCLQEIEFRDFPKIQHVGWEFIIGGTTSLVDEKKNNFRVRFPKLRLLQFVYFPEWKEWEDISGQDEDDQFLSIMPCFEGLAVSECGSLAALPERLLRKLPSLKTLNIRKSNLLEAHVSELRQINSKLEIITAHN